MKKLKILFDADLLFCNFNKNHCRSGLFWVAHNIFLEMNKRKDIKLTFYLRDNGLIDYAANLFNTDPNYKNVTFFNLNNIYLNKYNKIQHKIDKNKLKIRANKISYIHKIGKKIQNKFLKIERFYYNKKLKTIDIFKHYDVYFSPVNCIPEDIKNNNIKKAIILHDTIPYIFPQFFADLDHNWVFQVVNSLDKDVYCFPNSNNTKKDFLHYCADKVDENKMFVIPLSTSIPFKQINDINKLNEILDKYKVPKNKRGKYIFSLCTLEPRKGLIHTMKCFIKFIEKNNIDDLYFYLGGGHWDTFIAEIEKEITNINKYKDKIVKLGYIDDEDLNILYSHSLWFTYLSLYEGFGMPPLEAMSSGVPVITSNTSSLPEVVGDAAIMIDPQNEEACIKAFEDLYYNEDLRKELIQKGLKQKNKFSWEKCVDIIINNLLKK